LFLQQETGESNYFEISQNILFLITSGALSEHNLPEEKEYLTTESLNILSYQRKGKNTEKHL
jgi:hypothetical protein